MELFNGLGSIDFIRYISNDRFVVSSSTSSYLVNAQEHKIEATLPIRGITDVDFDDSSYYLATNIGLYIAPLNDHGAGKQQWLRQKKEQFPFANWRDSSAAASLLLPQRTRSVRYDPLNHLVYASTKNGLVKIDKTGPQPFLINRQNVYSTTLAYKNGRLYIGTVNDGLWLVAHNQLQHFTTANTLASNTLIRIKATEDHLWLFERSGIQVLDIHSNQILRNLDLPKIEGTNVLDVAEKGNMSYLTTSGGIYRVPFNRVAVKMRPAGFLDYVLVNGTDTLQQRAETLPYQKNDVQF
ncbi:MAG TPA: hypothetical protein VFL47_08015, partial [Flavisolibacter sp.]|nr:hypothetical protein [Flavisolibacter sp.]